MLHYSDALLSVSNNIPETALYHFIFNRRERISYCFLNGTLGDKKGKFNIAVDGGKLLPSVITRLHTRRSAGTFN